MFCLLEIISSMFKFPRYGTKVKFFLNLFLLSTDIHITISSKRYYLLQSLDRSFKMFSRWPRNSALLVHQWLKTYLTPDELCLDRTTTATLSEQTLLLHFLLINSETDTIHQLTEIWSQWKPFLGYKTLTIVWNHCNAYELSYY